jgi:hypothetical protein
LSSPQQEVQSEEKKQPSSSKYDDDGNSNSKKEKMKVESPPPIKEEAVPEKPRRDLIPTAYQNYDDDDNNSKNQEDEKITIDYMAKDYASFRNALLDLIPRKLPQWNDRSEADMGIMLIELFSYIADELSYFQDRVANEAFLRTARARSSINNHLSLIDYHMHNGMSANAFIKVEVNKSAIIPAGFQVSTYPEKGQKAAGTIIFQTLQDQHVVSDYNDIPVDKIDNDYSNSSSITLNRTAIMRKRLPELKKGHQVLFFQEDRLTRVITRRMVVKLAEDSKIIDDGNNTLITWKKGEEYPEPIFGWKPDVICCANILRASHGQTIQSEILKHRDQNVSKFLFTLKEAPLTFISVSDNSSISSSAPMEARSTLIIWVDGELWEETDSLVKCGPFDQKFSISIDEDGYATVLFGDGKFGLKPDDNSLIEAQYRVGNGSVGNVSKDTLTRFDLPQNPRVLVEEVIQSVTNPLPATGGVDIESKDDAQIAGPKSLKVLARAVTLKDYEDLVKRKFQNEITNARARFVYTGTWDTIFVSVDLKGDRKNAVDNDPELIDKIRKYLDSVKMIGYEVQLEEPKYVPIEIGIRVHLQKYFDSEIVRDRIRSSLSSKDEIVNGGSKGLFHPDNFTFGDAVYASKIYEVLKKNPEVKYGIISTFRKRKGSSESINSKNMVKSSSSSSRSFPSSEISIAQRDEETRRNLEQGFIHVNDNEIVTIDDDPSNPENGILNLEFVEDNEYKNDENDDYHGYSLTSDVDNSEWY